MPKLSWYWNRLRAMSAGEVQYRLRHLAQTRVDRALLARERLPGAELPEPLEPEEIPFFFDPARRVEMQAAWAQHYPEGVTRLRAEADELLAGRARIFDREMTWDEVPDWHADLLNGGEWPRRFWSEMQIRNGGVKYVWELSRHQHLMTLARAWHLTGEMAYGTTACRWLKSWIDENPPYTGIHWTSALELALRLVAWSWLYRLLHGHPGWTRDLGREFFRLVQLQAEFIRRYPSAHSSANNHLIGEAAGVAVSGLAFPWLAGADRWREWGLSVLAEELPKQCHVDGVGAEQAFHYQAFVIDLVLQPVLLGRYQSRETPAELPERLEAMSAFLYDAMDASGHLPEIGDADDGAAIVLGQDLHRPYRSLLATCGVLFNRPEFCRAGGTFDEKSAWLLGPHGRERFEKLAATGAERARVVGRVSSDRDGRPQITDGTSLETTRLERASRQFAQGGYTVMRSSEGAGEQVLFMDHGPLGYLSIAAHGHADCLSLTLSLGGRPVLVDPGTYTYHEQPVWREYFRGTPAHNTVTVDGQHQSVMTGATMWGAKANGRCRRWVTRPEFDFVTAEHDGYHRLPGRPLHRRTVFHRRDGITFVIDHLLGDGTHAAELNWHLAAGTRLQREESGLWTASGDSYSLAMAVLAEQDVETAVVEGQEQPPQGWVSPRFGERVPAPVLSSRRRGGLPMAWATLLLPIGAGTEWSLGEHGWSATGRSAAAPKVSSQIDHRAAVITLEYPDHLELFAHSFAGRGDPARARGRATSLEGPEGSTGSSSFPWLDLGQGRFRGEALHLRLDTGGKPLAACLVGGLELEWDGQPIWRFEDDPVGGYVEFAGEQPVVQLQALT